MKQSLYIRKEHNNKSGYYPVLMDGGFLIGHKGPKGKVELVFELLGEINFDDTIDDFMSGLYHICAVALIENDSTKEAREEIYTRVVQAFSLIMDKFNPEAKDRRSDIMSPEELDAVEAILEENKVLKNAINK